MKILLTGGNGFIGRNILEQLGDKYEFISPGSKDLDLTDSGVVASFLKSNRPDLIIHSANLGGKRSDANINDVAFINLRMFFNIVRNKEYFKRMIVFGSGAEYDKRFDIKDVSEIDFDKKVPIDQYGFYKYACSKYIESVDFITNLRIFGMYGKHEDCSTRFISNNICRTLLNLPVSLNQNKFFEMVFVDDFVKILDYFINNEGKEKFYNIGNQERLSLLDISQKILKKAEKDLPLLIKKDGFGNEYTCNAKRLKDEIPGLTFTSIDEGVSKLFSYYSNKIEDIKKGDILFD